MSELGVFLSHPKRIARLGWGTRLEEKCRCAVPTGLRRWFVESVFPTLKRGANKHCAYGAVALVTKPIASGSVRRCLEAVS